MRQQVGWGEVVPSLAEQLLIVDHSDWLLWQHWRHPWVPALCFADLKGAADSGNVLWSPHCAAETVVATQLKCKCYCLC